MKPNFVVLTDSSPAGERAQAYAAALAAPLGPSCTWCMYLPQWP
ncbi:hypothetical protein [Hymenobacter sp. BRD128]|nr:hypothetical protein [Hymenobacter sp. BRD128]